MKQEEIIEAFRTIREKEPHRYYSALGYDIDMMDLLISGSYDLGLVVGALWAFDQMGGGQNL